MTQQPKRREPIIMRTRRASSGRPRTACLRRQLLVTTRSEIQLDPRYLQLEEEHMAAQSFENPRRRLELRGSLLPELWPTA